MAVGKGRSGGHGRRLMVIVLASLGALALGAAGGYVSRQVRLIEASLPNVEAVRRYRNDSVTRLFDRRGRLIHEFTVERRYPVPLASMPPYLVQAIVSVEDERFFQHQGIDTQGVVRAAIENLRAGRIVEGASTLTQQLARGLFLSRDRLFTRKLKEQLLALQMEKILTKNEILELYLNEVYLGHGAYGVEAAARTYFGKSVGDLTLGEAALLAGLPQAPSRYSPALHPELARRRRTTVLRRMARLGFITSREAEAAAAEPIRLVPRRDLQTPPHGAYFVETVRQWLETSVGSEAVHRGGLDVATTLDLDLQEAAERAIDMGLRAHDRRQGFRGPLDPATLPDQWRQVPQEFAPGDRFAARYVGRRGRVARFAAGQRIFEVKAENYEWAGKPLEGLFEKDGVYLLRVLDVRPSKGDEEAGIVVELDQPPLAQAALVALDVQTGDVLALVGGADFRQSKFNRALQSRRQPGSAFKPFIYAAALALGRTPSTVIVDAPIIKGKTAEADAYLRAKRRVVERLQRLRDPGASDDLSEEEQEAIRKEIWKPGNYSGRFYGATTLRTALEHSRNIVTIKLLADIGVEPVIALARAAGIESDLRPNLSLALGSSGVSLMELTSAYSIFPGGGRRVVPRMVRSVIQDHEVLSMREVVRVPALDERVAYVMTQLLRGVVEEGTAVRARWLGHSIAGKTGTTNEYHDAWFIGFSPRILAGVWIGYDEVKPLGRREAGSRAALPIWIEFMKAALRDQPEETYPVPEGVTFETVDAETGMVATERCPKIRMEVFVAGTEPTERCRRHDPAARDFMSLDLGLPEQGAKALDGEEDQPTPFSSD